MDNRVELEIHEKLRQLRVFGEVDLSWSQDLRDAILRQLADGHAVLVDLGGVSYIDSSGIAALVEGFQTARRRNQHFALLQPSAAVIAVLELARLDRVFPMHADLDQAVAAIG